MKRWLLALLLILCAGTAWAEEFRPNSYYEPNALATATPASAYDGSVSTSADTTNHLNNATIAIQYGRNASNGDQWSGTGDAGDGCVLWVHWSSVCNGNDSGAIYVTNSADTTLYTVLSLACANNTAAWYSVSPTSGECADYGDFRIQVYTDKVGGNDSPPSTTSVHDIYVESVSGRQRMIIMGKNEEEEDEEDCNTVWCDGDVCYTTLLYCGDGGYYAYGYGEPTGYYHLQDRAVSD